MKSEQTVNKFTEQKHNKKKTVNNNKQLNNEHTLSFKY